MVTESVSAPLVTVVILNWNGRHLLADCIPSVLAQRFDGFEVMLVDNGSSDGSVQWVRERYPGVRVLPLSANVGFCAGNNAGIRAARGEYVVLLNNDTRMEDGWLEPLYDAISRDSSVAACDSKVLYHDRPDRIWSAGGTYSVAGTAGFRWQMELDGPQHQAPCDVFVAGACSAIYRRSVFDEIGMLDEQFFAGYEDVDWSFRAHLRGYRAVNIPASRVYHKVSATHGLGSAGYVYHGQRNVSAVFFKNMPTPLLLRYWPLHMLYTVGSMLYFAKGRRAGAFARAKWDVARMLPSLWGKRCATQRLRSVSSAEIDALLSREWFGPKVAKFRGRNATG